MILVALLFLLVFVTSTSQSLGRIQEVEPPNLGVEYSYGVDCRGLRWIYFWIRPGVWACLPLRSCASRLRPQRRDMNAAAKVQPPPPPQKRKKKSRLTADTFSRMLRKLTQDELALRTRILTKGLNRGHSGTCIQNPILYVHPGYEPTTLNVGCC